MPLYADITATLEISGCGGRQQEQAIDLSLPGKRFDGPDQGSAQPTAPGWRGNDQRSEQAVAAMNLQPDQASDRAGSIRGDEELPARSGLHTLHREILA